MRVLVHSTRAGGKRIQLFKTGEHSFAVNDGYEDYRHESHEDAAHSYGRAIMRALSSKNLV